MPSGDFRTTYREERAIFGTWSVRVCGGAFVLALLCVPLFADRYVLYLLTLAGIYLISATGLNLLTGNTGQISLGQAAFMAIGAYASAIISGYIGVPFVFLVVMGGTLAALASVVVGVPSLRLRGLYLALATVAFQFIVEFVIYRGAPLTGGAAGLSVPAPSVLGISLDTDHRYYYAVLVGTLAMLMLARNLLRTRVGRAFMAVRDRDIAAEIAGINVTRYKILAFAVSAFYGGVAGSLLAHQLRYITPESFTLLHSVTLTAMIIIGGLGSVLGSVLGAVFMVLLPEAIRLGVGAVSGRFPVLEMRFAFLQDGIFGLIIILFLMFEPGGLVGTWRSVKTYWRTWPYSY